MSFFLKLFFLLRFIFIIYSTKSCEEFDNPINEEDCHGFNTVNESCCFVTITKQDNSSENRCWSIDKDKTYFLNFLDTFSYKNYTNIKASFSCEQIDQPCGINSPKELYECSEHSSKSKSCCLLYTPTLTDCVLSQKKYVNETNVTIFDENYYVTCFGYFIPNKYKLLFLFILYLF